MDASIARRKKKKKGVGGRLFHSACWLVVFLLIFVSSCDLDWPRPLSGREDGRTIKGFSFWRPIDTEEKKIVVVI